MALAAFTEIPPLVRGRPNLYSNFLHLRRCFHLGILDSQLKRYVIYFNSNALVIHDENIRIDAWNSVRALLLLHLFSEADR